jgi:hypothetical protein
MVSNMLSGLEDKSSPGAKAIHSAEWIFNQTPVRNHFFLFAILFTNFKP